MHKKNQLHAFNFLDPSSMVAKQLRKCTRICMETNLQGIFCDVHFLFFIKIIYTGGCIRWKIRKYCN